MKGSCLSQQISQEMFVSFNSCNKNQFRNDSETEVIFLVVSVPKAYGDRIDA